MYRLRQFSGLAGVAGIAGANFLSQGTTPRGKSNRGRAARCEVAHDDDDGKDSSGFVGVFLDAPSIAKVKQLGGQYGSISMTRSPHALIYLHPDGETRQSFSPLFGSKAKVHVRGVAEDQATKQKVMIVQVSVGGEGESSKPIMARPYVPTIAFASEKWGDDVSDLLGVDLARRLHGLGVFAIKGSWDGVLPAQVLDGIKYPATRAIFTEIEPLALEGTVCVSTDYDKDGAQCLAKPVAHASHQHEGGAIVEDGKVAEGDEEDVPGECPLCTYMMGTPCKDVFVVFKECMDRASDSNEQGDLQRCEPMAKEVMACAQKHKLFAEVAEDEEEENVEGGEVQSSPSVQATSPVKQH